MSDGGYRDVLLDLANWIATKKVKTDKRIRRLVQKEKLQEASRYRAQWKVLNAAIDQLENSNNARVVVIDLLNWIDHKKAKTYKLMHRHAKNGRFQTANRRLAQWKLLNAISKQRETTLAFHDLISRHNDCGFSIR